MIFLYLHVRLLRLRRLVSGTPNCHSGTIARRLNLDADVHGPVDAVTEDTTVLEVLPATRHSSYVHGVHGNPSPTQSCSPRGYMRARIACIGASIESISSPALPEFLNTLSFLILISAITAQDY